MAMEAFDDGYSVILDRGNIVYRGQDEVHVDTCADAYHNLLL